MAATPFARSLVACTLAVSTALTAAACAGERQAGAAPAPQPTAASPAQQPTGSTHVMVAPTDLKWGDAPSLPPGAKVALIEGQLDQAVPFTLRLRLPADYQIPAHRHPAVEHTTVLSGSVNMGMGDSLDRAATTAMPTGSVVIMPAGTSHFLWTTEETILQVHGVGPFAITYVDPADDPRTK